MLLSRALDRRPGGPTWVAPMGDEVARLRALLADAKLVQELPDRGAKLRARLEALQREAAQPRPQPQQPQAPRQEVKKAAAAAPAAAPAAPRVAFTAQGAAREGEALYPRGAMLVSAPVRVFESAAAEKQRERVLADLLESNGRSALETLPEAAPSPQLRAQLYPHQLAGLRWLLARERLTGEEKDRPKPLGAHKSVRGGILADDMGLGKTMQIIALILTAPQFGGARGPTLVICPTAVLLQWASEIGAAARPGALRVVVHHGRRRTRDKEELARADVVLSTYATLQSEAAARRHGAAKDEATRRDTLLRVEWHRVVLDEAHCIRNVKSKTAQAAITLRATARWALTGTPLHNELDDLFSLFCFLHLAPLSDRDYWRSEVLRAGKAGIDRVHAVLTELMLRRTKADRSPAGAPIVELPLRTVEVRRLDASADERALLTALSASLRSEADALGDADRRAPLLVMLLRLRQACCFSSLCRAGAPRSAPAVPQLAAIEAAVERSISRSGVDVPPAPASPAAASDADAELNEVLRQLAALRVSDKAGADEGDDAAAQGGGEEDDETVAALAASLASLSVGEMAATGDEGKKGESVKQSEGKSEPSPKPSQSQPPPPPPPPPPRPPPASSKLRFLLEHLDALRAKSPDDKVVVFSQWVSVLRLLQPPLEAAGHRCVLFDGSLSPEQRSRALAEFRGDAGVRVCLMSLMSGGVGLNLTAANHVVMFDLWWNPAVEQQAYDRVYRLGQRKPVSILRLVLRDSVEERLLALQERKAELAARALQRSAASARDLAALRALSAEELLGLLG